MIKNIYHNGVTTAKTLFWVSVASCVGYTGVNAYAFFDSPKRFRVETLETQKPFLPSAKAALAEPVAPIPDAEPDKKEPIEEKIMRTSEDAYNLMLNAYHEARGEVAECETGQVAQVWVTLNRVHDRRWGDNIEQVVYDKSAFSWTHDGHSDSIKDHRDAEHLLGISMNVLLGTIPDPTGGATHYHNPAKVRKQPKQYFHSYDRVKICNHIFYKVCEPGNIDYPSCTQYQLAQQ